MLVAVTVQTNSGSAPGTERTLSGKVALVSGVARAHGLGRATALRLARAGATLVVAELVDQSGNDTATVTRDDFDRVSAEIADAASAAQTTAIAIPQTATGPQIWQDLVDTTVERAGRLDICCSLNGVTGPAAGDGLLLDITPSAWQRAVDINLTAGFLLMTAAARAMIAGGQGGSIVQLSTSATRTAKPHAGAVGATRRAVEFLIETLAQEVGEYGIRCNAVAPLGIASTTGHGNPGLERLAAREGGGNIEEWVRRTIPLGRFQDVDETAACIEFLCSDDASFVSGVTLPVMGGANT
jgi:NAD(P)-dependent dehydrogenase (short-subunit alcohol dehydrogenase family)